MIPSKQENPSGLHRRYNVTKADGSPTDPNATYFVLRIDYGGSDIDHIRACRAAAAEYARWAPPHMRQVGSDLRQFLAATELNPDNEDRRLNPDGTPLK